MKKYMRALLFVFFSMLIIASCSKDKFSDKPMLTLKSVSSKHVPKGGVIQIKIEYTDAQGDIAGVPLFAEKQSSSYPCDDSSKKPTFLDSLSYIIPGDVPATSNQKGEIVVTWEYYQLQPIACDGADTVESATFKFWLRDQAGNMSDTVSTPIITIEK